MKSPDWGTVLGITMIVGAGLGMMLVGFRVANTNLALTRLQEENNQLRQENYDLKQARWR